MGETAAGLAREPLALTPDEKLDFFLDGLQVIRDQPDGQDPRISHFAVGMQTAVKSRRGEVRAAMQGVLDDRLEHQDEGDALRSAIYLGKLSLRAIGSQLWLARDYLYPQDFNRPADWPRPIREIFAGSLRSFNSDGIYVDLRRDLTSNIGARMKGPILAAAAYEDRFDPEDFTVYDLGCSQGLGLKQWTARGLYPFEATAGLRTSTRFPKGPFVDRKLSAKLDRIIATAIEPTQCNGIDIVRPDDFGNMLWAFICSHYPSDLEDDALTAHFLRLASFRSPRLAFTEADFMNEQQLESRILSSGQADMAIMSTVVYMMPESEQAVAIERAVRCVKKGGIVVVNEFAKPNPDMPYNLEFLIRWYDELLPYKTFVYDTLQPEAGLQLVAEWSNGRCTAVKPNLKHANVGKLLGAA